MVAIRELASTYDDIIKVRVGDQKTFSVHKDLICAKSKFFKTAFMNANGNWRETEEILVRDDIEDDRSDN